MAQIQRPRHLFCVFILPTACALTQAGAVMATKNETPAEADKRRRSRRRRRERRRAEAHASRSSSSSWWPAGSSVSARLAAAAISSSAATATAAAAAGTDQAADLRRHARRAGEPVVERQRAHPISQGEDRAGIARRGGAGADPAGHAAAHGHFQTYLRELRPTDLDGSAGLYRLKEELTRRVNAAIAPNRINAVLFKEIVVQ